MFLAWRTRERTRTNTASAGLLLGGVSALALVLTPSAEGKLVGVILLTAPLVWMALRWAAAEPAHAVFAGWLLAVGQQPIEGYARSLSRTAGLVATRSDDGYLIFLLAV